MPGAPVFDLKPEEVLSLSDRLINELEEKINIILHTPAHQRNFANTVAAFEEATAAFAEGVTVPVFLAYTSDNAALRDAAMQLQMKISQYSVDLNTREDIYNALKEYCSKGEKNGEIEQRLLDKIMLGFRQNGLGLPEKQRRQVKKLMKELVSAELKFSKNLREVNDFLEVDEEELKGLPADYKARLKKSSSGKYIITLNYPDYIPFMANAENGDARRRLEFLFNNRGGKTNVALLEKAIGLRRRIAKLLGYKNYADYVLSDRMAGNSTAVKEFQERLRLRLKAKGKAELAERIKLKGGKEKFLHAWETAYYNNLLKKTKYSIDEEKIKEYFPLETVLSGMLDTFGNLLGAKFVPAQLPVWHKDVRAYEVRNDDGSIAAYFYFDLFPRDGKYKHAACFGIRSGRRLPDGSYNIPAAAIVANFTPSTGEKPSLMKFDDVVTLFHEFGHVTHNIFTTAEYATFSGTSVSRDFVEVPSQILENWAYQPEVLKKISGHFRNPDEKLPDETIQKIIAARNMDSGLFYLRQLLFGILDMYYHTAAGKVDTTKVYARLMKKIALVPMSEGTHPQASFGHIMGGYEAGYYSYLWSRVISVDLFGRFLDTGVMNRETGRRYRELILAPGRSYDEAGQVRKFLGRDSTEDAFLRDIDAA